MINVILKLLTIVQIRTFTLYLVILVYNHRISNVLKWISIDSSLVLSLKSAASIYQ